MQPRLPKVSLPTAEELGLMDRPSYPSFGGGPSTPPVSESSILGAIGADQFRNSPRPQLGTKTPESLIGMEPQKDDPGLFSSSFQNIISGFNWVDNNVTKPVVALALAGTLFKQPFRFVEGEAERVERTDNIIKNVFDGELSLGKAWDQLAEIQSERPFSMQLGTELVLDPLNLAAAPLIKGPQYIQKGLRAINQPGLRGIDETIPTGTTGFKTAEQGYQPAALPDTTEMLDRVYDPTDKMNQWVNNNPFARLGASFFNPSALADTVSGVGLSMVKKFELLKMQFDEIIDGASNLESSRLNALIHGQQIDRGYDGFKFESDYELIDLYRKSEIGSVPPSSVRLAEELPKLFKEAVEAKYYTPGLSLEEINKLRQAAKPIPGVTFDLGRVADSEVFRNSAARIGITPIALRGYMETARREVIRQMAARGSIFGEPGKLTNVRVRELLQDPWLQRRVHELLSDPTNVKSPTMINAIDEAIRVAVRREARRPKRKKIFFNEVMQNPDDFTLTPGQLRTINEINNVFAGMRNHVLDALKAIPGADITEIDQIFKPVKGNYFPGIWKMYDDLGYLKETGDSSIFNQIKGYENTRLYDYATDALNAGLRPIDPVQAINITLKGMYQHIAEAKLATLVGAWSPTAMKRIKQGIRMDADDLIESFKMDPVTKRKIRDILKPESNTLTRKFIDSAASASVASRTLQSAFDLGAPLIHGLPVLMDQPTVWTKSVENSLAAMGDPLVISRLISENMDTLHKLNSHNMLHGGGSDLIESLYKGGMLERGLAQYGSRRVMQVRGKGVPRGTEQLAPETPGQYRRRVAVSQAERVTGGIQRQFEAFLLSSKIGLWQSMEGMIPKQVAKQARKKGIIEGTPEYSKLQREVEGTLASHIAKMTGTVSMANLGLSPSRRKIISGLIMYAPRYRMACYGLMADVFRGGMKSELAITRLSKMMMAGTYYYALTAYKLNQDPQLNPFEPGFMSIKIGNTDIGLGSAYMSVLNLLTQIVSGAIPLDNDKYNGESWWDSQSGFNWERGRDIASTGLQHLRSQTSSLTGTGIDIATGHDYSGEPLPESIFSWDAAKMVGDTIAPFWLSSVWEHPKSTYVEGSWITDIPAGMVGGGIGLRSMPSSSYSKAMDLADIETQKLAEEFGWTEGDAPWEYHNLNKLQKNEIISRNPQIQVYLDEHYNSLDPSGRYKLLSTEAEVQVREAYSAFHSLSQRKKEEIEDITVYDQLGYEQPAYRMINKYIRDIDDQGNFTGDLIWYSGEDYRNQIKGIMSDMSVRYDDIKEQYPLGLAEMEDNFQSQLRSGKVNDFDAAYHIYIRDVVAQDYDRPDGEFDYKDQHLRKEQFLNSLPPGQRDELWSYITARRVQGLGPAVENMRYGQDRMTPYWNVGSLILKSLNLESDYESKLDRYRDAPQFERDQMVAQDPLLKTIISGITKARQNIRRENASIDAWLFRWGYTGEPLNPDNQLAYYNDPHAFMTEFLDDLPDW